MRWIKKLGPQHRMDVYKTLCGKPMLGNNYYKIRTDVIDCEECEAIYLSQHKVDKNNTQ